MKTTLLAVLTGLLMTASASGQGTIIFNNRTPTGDARITGPDGKGLGAGWFAQLYLVSGGGVVLTPLEPITTFRTSSPAAAFFVHAVIVTVPGIPAGSPATVRLRFWQGGESYETNPMRGESNDVLIPQLGGVPPGGGAPIPTPGLNGLVGVALIPEPSTLTLVLLGAATLLLRRRRD